NSAPRGAQFDHEEDIQSGQADRLHGEEITGQGSGGLAAQELRPAGTAAAGCRAEAVPAQDCAHRRRGHLHAEFAALAGDAEIAPSVVVAGQPQHQLNYLRIEPSPSAGGWVGPPLSTLPQI